MTEDVEEIASFIAAMQARADHRMAMCGLKAGEIADQIEEFDVAFVTRREEEDIVGVLGVDYDPEMRRSWLYGPFVVDEPGWDEMADALWRDVSGLVPPGAKDVDIAYVVTNARAAAFAARHGFETFSEGAVMTFPRERLSDLPGSPDVRPIGAEDRGQVAQLHAALFPDVWPPAGHMFERLNEHREVFVAAEANEVLGYLHAEVKPQHGEGFIEFVGVREEARGRGMAKQMVSAALRWMLSFAGMEEIELYVRDDNPAARRVYSSVGFTPSVNVIGARLRL